LAVLDLNPVRIIDPWARAVDEPYMGIRRPTGMCTIRRMELGNRPLYPARQLGAALAISWYRMRDSLGFPA